MQAEQFLGGRSLRHLQRTTGEERSQLKLLLLGIFVAFFSGGLTHFVTVHILPIHPIFNLLITIYALVTTYAIFKYRLFALEETVRKSIVYTLLLSVVTTVYFISIFFLERIFRQSLGYTSTHSILIMLLILALFSEPLRQFIQSVVDKFFFKSRLVNIVSESAHLRREIIKQDQLKSIATFAAGMAHEIKNPLTSIRTFAEYLPSRYDDPVFRENFSRIVVDEVDRINSIVQQLLDFSKPRELELTSVSPVMLLEDTLALLNNNFLQTNISIVRDYRITSNTQIYVDGAQFKQAILNILLNSIQAMDAGGVLTIRIWERGSRIYLNIADTGVGIPKDKVSRIFDPFYTTKENGSGLGLSIVNTIVSIHKGKIAVRSKEGVGTSIQITLTR